MQEVQLVHGRQPRSDLARHPLQQQDLRTPPQVLVAQVGLQVALKNTWVSGASKPAPHRAGELQGPATHRHGMTVTHT